MSIRIFSDEVQVTNSGAELGSPSIAGASDLEGWFLAWEGPMQPEDYNELFGKARPTFSPVVQINTEESDPQFDPDIAMLPNGNFVIAYDSGIEDSLPGTYLAHQIVQSDGTKVGSEIFSPNYSYYHVGPDVGVLSDSGFIVVAGQEFDGVGYIYANNNTLIDEFSFGYSGVADDKAVAILPDDDFLVVWMGYRFNPLELELLGDELGQFGVWAQHRNIAGSADEPFLVSASVPGPLHAQLDAVTLADGSVAIGWTDYDGVPSPGGPTDIFAAVVDASYGAVTTAPFKVNVHSVGSQLDPELVALDNGYFVVNWQDDTPSAGDLSGSSVHARVFTQDGKFDQADVIVNQTTLGDQQTPSISLFADGRVTVAWESAGDIYIRTVDAGPAGLASNVYPGSALDGSDSADQNLVGDAGRNAFLFDSTAISGVDRIQNFDRDDLFVTSEKIFDGNGDGIIGLGGNNAVDLDGVTGFSDLVYLDGVSNKAALRYLGFDGNYVYGLGIVRPRDALEGTILDNSEVLSGDVTNSKTDVFFIDTALNIGLGPDDEIANFGKEDVLVLTTKIFDGNNDGIIQFGSDKLLDIGPEDIRISNKGIQITSLEYDGMVQHDGIDYFVYSRVGSTGANVDDVLF